MWEEALAIDPHDARANSYIDYLRGHYDELSVSEPAVTTGDDEPFAIHEEPEYQIEITPGQLIARESQPMLANDDPIDAGWFDDEQTHDAGARLSNDTLELEADEPPPPPEVNFDDATREYFGAPTRPSSQRPSQSEYVDAPHSEFEHGEYTGGFGSEGTPVGFATQETEIRKRDLGFVQPAGTDPGQNSFTAGTTDPGERTQERVSFSNLPTDDDLLVTMPRARPASNPPEDAKPRKANTRDLPGEPRPPARRDSADLSQAEVMLPHTQTKDFDPSKIDVGAPTRDLGLRANPPMLSNPVDEDAPTGQADVRAIRAAAARDDGRASQADVDGGTRHDIVLPFDPIDARSAQILDEVDAECPDGEDDSERTRRRIGLLLDKAVQYSQAGDGDRAVTAVDLALSEDPNSALGQKLITRNRDTILSIFQSFIGDLERQPQLAKPLHELQNAPISPRAAFLLSRIDGTLTVDELLDVSGMPRMEAYRHLCQLMLRGILR